MTYRIKRYLVDAARTVEVVATGLTMDQLQQRKQWAGQTENGTFYLENYEQE